jgi:hypothetical protein
LALFVVYKCLYWFYDYNLLFSEQSIVYKNDLILPFWQWPAFILFKSHAAALSVSFLAGVFMAAIYVLFSGKHLRAAFFILWFGILNINNNVYPTLSGGDYLFQHLLFFCIFLSNSNLKQTNLHSLDIAANNFGIIAIRIQVCLVYLLAGYAKIMDADWLNGTAVNDVFSVRDYSMPFLYESNSAFGKELNYLVIGYQLLFPILVWIRRIKKWFLLMGVLQHLFIAFIIGLPSFGFIMIIAYAIFYVPGRQTKNSS